MSERLTSTESFMWSLGQDPNLASTMGLLAVLDAAPSTAQLEATVTNLVASVDRLRLRVNDPLGVASAIGGLEWVPDEQFDLDYHLRTTRLPTEGCRPDSEPLRRLATQFVNDPFDRTRPLWQFLVVEGLADDAAALLGKFHHSISDGLGLVRVALNLLQFEADAPVPPTIDLTKLDPDSNFANGNSTDRNSVENNLKAGAERIVGLLQNRPRLSELPQLGQIRNLGDVATAARAAGVKLGDAPQPSPLWANRSRNRRFELHTESLESIQGRAQDLDVSVNDLFVAACAQAAIHYHDEFDVDLEHVLATVVVNLGDTNSNDDPTELGEDNKFLPVAVQIPGTEATLEDRLAAVKDQVRKRRAMLEGKAATLEGLSNLGTFVPPALAATLMLGQAARVDFATSNVVGLPLPAWFAGQGVQQVFPIGPVTGTAFNITMLSYHRHCQFGIHIDPAAISDPYLLAKSIGLSFRELGVLRA